MNRLGWFAAIISGEFRIRGEFANFLFAGMPVLYWLCQSRGLCGLAVLEVLAATKWLQIVHGNP